MHFNPIVEGRLLRRAWEELRDARLGPAEKHGRACSLSPALFVASYIQSDIIDSLQCIRDFPEAARHDAGYQLEKVQRGEQPSDFKPMGAIGKGVEEIRIMDDSGAYCVIYVARRGDAVYVLHAFQKKTHAKKDVDIAKRRYEQLSRGRR